MTVGAIGAIGALSGVTPIAANALTAATPAASGGFADALTKGVDSLQATQSNVDSLAVKAATGDLTDVHDYTIAATQASLMTELTVTLRNKALDAFNEIMRMPI